GWCCRRCHGDRSARMAHGRRKAPVIKAHLAPEAAPPPTLFDEVAPLIRMEREVDEEFRPAMRTRLVEKIREFDALQRGTAPRCVACKRAMKSRGQLRAPSLLTRFGEL